MGGVWGTLATGLFATTSVNPAGLDGLFYGNPAQLFTQAWSVVVVAVFAFVMTYVIATVLNRVMGLRAHVNEEEVGLDISQHGERAFS